MAGGQIVISQAELERIKQTLLPENERYGWTKQARENAAELHAKSQARAKTWSNTLAGSRRKKAEEKRLKLEMEELERQKIDMEEARIQLDQRKATIDRANKLLYEQSDRMKAFHSKMNLCDVLDERAAQAKLKDEVKQLEQIREDRFLEMDKQNYRRKLEREIKEKDAREELRRETARAQMEQSKSIKDAKFKEAEEYMREGEAIRLKAIEDHVAENRAQQKRRERNVKALQEQRKANGFLKQIKAEEKLKEQREDEKIAEAARDMKAAQESRKKKEREAFQQKQVARNRMIDMHSSRISAMVNDEDYTIARQNQVLAIEDEKKRIDRELQTRKWQADIEKSRLTQIQRKCEERARAKATDMETAKFMNEWCQVLDEQEQDEKARQIRAQKNLALENQGNVIVQNQARVSEKKSECIAAIQAKKAIEADTVEFYAYAEGRIKEYAEEGKNVVPILKELRGFRKRVLE